MPSFSPKSLDRCKSQLCHATALVFQNLFKYDIERIETYMAKTDFEKCLQTFSLVIHF
jgi:hypothetical protein